MAMHQNFMKHTFRTILAAAVAAVAVFSCDKPFELDLPLAVNNHKLTLQKEAGSTHILVYANGPWTAEFSRNIEWASLNKLSGEGNNDLVLSYSANYGISRNVGIILSAGALKDTISITQIGEVAEGSVSFGSAAVALLRSGASMTLPISTNMQYSLSEFKVATEYFDNEGTSLGVDTFGEATPDTLKITPWITVKKLTKSKLDYDVAENATGEVRQAVIRVFVEDATGDVFAATQAVTQGITDAALVLGETAGTYAGFSGEYIIPATENNVYLYSNNLSYTIPETAAEWISAVKLTDIGLSFKLSKNESGADRSATVQVSYQNGESSVSQSYAITQKAYPSAISFEELRAMTPGTISSLQYIEGYIVSSAESENNCQNPQTAQFKFDITETHKTAYIESVDGKYGFQLKFNTAEDNVTERWTRVRISVNGLTLEKETSPVTCYTLSGLTADSIIETLGVADSFLVPAKKKKISDLTDDDVFTLVSLQDVEIMCKDGCYTNCTDGYSLKQGPNPVSGTGSAPRWDVAPLLMSDKNGDVIYMLTNSLTPWRRNGTFYGNYGWGSGSAEPVVAQGSGTFRGVVVSETLVRYGEVGRYQIRAIEQSDIEMENPAFSKTIVEWNWNDKAANVTPEIGEGTLNVYGATTAAASDFNSMMPDEYGTKGQAGLVPSGALKLTHKWWDFTNNVGNYFDISFSTEGISGTNMVFGIVWNHGAMGNTTLDSPAHWNLLYSVDNGATFKQVGEMIKNRSIVWWTTTSQDSTPGFKDHMRKLPAECFGKEKVILRVQVADKVTDTKPGTAAATYLENVGIEKGTLTDKATEIRIGTITVRYN
ncbi:MAG: BACON domain-containing protein [Bacteroidales bacterium]|nr:BACON domain-containing protein [Bacteroidales bacterium]